MSKSVLIVEDEFIVANGLRLVLEQAGYHVNGIAASAEQADEMLLTKAPDLVLLDIRLNGKQTGIDLARKLRERNIAFIYLSANSSQKVLEEARTTEPYGFLVKPFREKDLLVMLDIAWYRHQHSLESKLRQEESLQKQLMGIVEDKSAADQKLLQLARLLQQHIPFDLFILGKRPNSVSIFNDIAYLRTGFDEYQFIGEKEMNNITGKLNNPFSLIMEESTAGGTGPAYHHDLTNNGLVSRSLKNTLFDSFKVESYLKFPVVLSDGATAHYFFYSRQGQVYTDAHIELLNRLKSYLTEFTQRLVVNEGLHSEISNQPVIGSREKYRNLDHPGFDGIIGNHPQLLATLDLTMQVAPYNTSVLILGESGTGKERIAQAIHLISPRKDSPFIKVNCAAIPNTLIESELFGHEKGAFTGAVERRAGKFEQADGGTIFLDEIGELPQEMQVKLLRVLQEREIDVIGGRLPRKVDVRVVAATSRNLEKEVAAGNFRLDLYYRLNVFPITLPPLRDRKSDIPALITFFAARFCREFNKRFTGIAQAMLDEMMRYSWPGNIRELENVVERSVILHEEKPILELKRSLSATETNTSEQVGIGTLDDVKKMQRETERVYIISILKKAEGRIRGTNGAAELLNLKPTTLESKMAKLGIKKEDIIGADNT